MASVELFWLLIGSSHLNQAVYVIKQLLPQVKKAKAINKASELFEQEPARYGAISLSILDRLTE